MRGAASYWYVALAFLHGPVDRLYLRSCTRWQIQLLYFPRTEWARVPTYTCGLHDCASHLPVPLLIQQLPSQASLRTSNVDDKHMYCVRLREEVMSSPPASMLRRCPGDSRSRDDPMILPLTT